MKTLRLIISLFISCLLLSCMTGTANGSKTSFELVNYGLYTGIRAGTIETPSGPVGRLSDVQIFEKTDQIPLDLDILFGIEIKYTDPNIEKLIITRKLKHPSFFDPYINKEETINVTQAELRNDRILFWGYKLEDKYELAPGSWVFEVWYHNELVISQEFIVKKM